MTSIARARDEFDLQAVGEALVGMWLAPAQLSFDGTAGWLRVPLGSEETRRFFLWSSSSPPKLLTHDLVIGQALDYRLDLEGAAAGPQPFEAINVSAGDVVVTCGFGAEIVVRIAGLEIDVIERSDVLRRVSTSA